MNKNPKGRQKRVHLQVAPMYWKTKPWRKDPSLETSESRDLILAMSVLWELNRI